DRVIVHRAHDPGGEIEARARDQLGPPRYADAGIALFAVPPTADLPGFSALPAAATAISDRAESYGYAPSRGWALLTGSLAGEGRAVTLSLDDQPVAEWQIDGPTPIRVPLPVAAGTYHAATLALAAPCPQTLNPALECRTVAVDDLALTFAPDESGLAAPVQFARDLTLARAMITESAARPGETLSVWLWWRFGAPVTANDVRFVHVIDAAGQLVVGQDNPLGAVAAGAARAEIVDLRLPDDLTMGTYRVYAGWYTFPDITRFDVLSDVPGALDRVVLIGEFEVVLD
ncbi:MAG: hypothetical protein GYB67_14730, partial [Chloroflexi bacterium]|nr:hypothetical protein [Chloroflexota bacterium]